MWDIWKFILLGWFVIGFLSWIILSPPVGYQDSEQARLSKRKRRKAENVITWIAIGYGALMLLFALGCIWYYFCGGVFVFADIGLSFGGKIVMGITTLLLLGFLIAGIIVIFKR